MFRPAALLLMLWAGGAGAADTDTSYVERGKFFTADDVPTFRIDADGTVDWFTASGYRRFHMVCHACHGPDATGTEFGPDLTAVMGDMDYFDFVDFVRNGSQRVTGDTIITAPAFGTNPLVMCFVDDLFVYLRARAVGALGPGMPARQQAQPETAREDAAFCLGE